jgi:RHS repeat-associated protein
MTSGPQPNTPGTQLCFVYDAWNRLAAIKSSSGTLRLTLAHDGLNRRIRTIVPQLNTWSVDAGEYYFDESWQLLETRIPNQGVTKSAYPQLYVWDLRYIDAPVLRTRSTQKNGNFDEVLYYCQDANFNTTALVTGSSGTVVEQTSYDAYGKATYWAGPSWSGSSVVSLTNNAVTFCGYHTSLVTGLNDVRNRPYTPLLGVWMTNDIGYPDGMNRYCAYFVPNGTDPSGLFLGEYHRKQTERGLAASGLSKKCIDTVADADVHQDDGFTNDSGPFNNAANHGDNGVPGIRNTITLIMQRWNGIKGVTKCDSFADEKWVLEDFGRILHAVQDLYSHSNYAETQDAASGGKSTIGTIPLWPMFNVPSNTPNIPPGITTGNYVKHIPHVYDPSPPPTHDQMNKDDPNTPAGKPTNNAGTSTFALANELATRHTALLWGALDQQMTTNPCWKKLKECFCPPPPRK